MRISNQESPLPPREIQSPRERQERNLEVQEKPKPEPPRSENLGRNIDLQA